jgi:hypothetical protein
MQPLVSLNYIWACRLWTIVNWVLAVGCFAAIIQLVFAGLPTERAVWRALWITIVPTASYFWSSIRVGQAGLLMVALCLGWAICRRNGRPFLGGVMLAAATAIKLAPGFLIPYLLIRRDWRGIAGVMIGAAIIFLVPAPWIGIDGAIRMHEDWAAHCRKTQVVEQTYRPENQSFLGALARLPSISNGHQLTGAEQLQALGRIYPLALLGFCVGIYGVLGWRGDSHSATSAESENFHLAVLFVAMTLCHPRAWTCNFGTLALPCAMLARMIVERSAGWRWALAALGFLACVCALPKVGHTPEWSWPVWVLQSKDLWAALFVISICGWRHWQRKLTVVPTATLFAKAA